MKKRINVIKEVERLIETYNAKELIVIKNAGSSGFHLWVSRILTSKQEDENRHPLIATSGRSAGNAFDYHHIVAKRDEILAYLPELESDLMGLVFDFVRFAELSKEIDELSREVAVRQGKEPQSLDPISLLALRSIKWAILCYSKIDSERADDAAQVLPLFLEALYASKLLDPECLATARDIQREMSEVATEFGHSFSDDLQDRWETAALFS